MKRGKKPKPTDQKKAKNTLRKSRVFEDEIKFDEVEGVPLPPTFLGSNGQAEWQRVVPQLSARGVLTVTDLNILAAYCHEVDQYFESLKILEAEGKYITITNKNGSEYKGVHPAVGVANNHLKNFLKIATEYGFTASSRTRISVSKSKSDPEKERFLKLVNG
jgi:P27 family predicted phage terminase small subunit